MKTVFLYSGIIIISIVFSCSRNKLEPKGFSVYQESQASKQDDIEGFAKDSLLFETRPSSVLLTGVNRYRLASIYKVNLNKSNETTFIGSNKTYSNYNEISYSNGNHWHTNFMPGLEAVYGYNLVNISHFDLELHKQKNFFESPVLIKTLYFPSFSKDTLNNKLVQRNYYLVSVYDEDTNKDGYINENDLRHFYHFDITANEKTEIIPKNYSVIRSEYDSANDFMYVFAKLDKNENGKGDDDEIHIFWIDLKEPKNNGLQY